MFDYNKIELGDIITFNMKADLKNCLVFFKGPALCKVLYDIGVGSSCNKLDKRCSPPVGAVWLKPKLHIGCANLQSVVSSKPAKTEQILLIASRVKNEWARECLKKILKDKL